MPIAKRIPYSTWTVTCSTPEHGHEAHPISASCRYPQTVERTPPATGAGR